MQKWYCEVCKTAEFDTSDDARDHEEYCRLIHINIGYEEGKKLGLDIMVNDEKEFYICHESAMNVLVRDIKSSLAKELLSLNSWDDMDDECLQNLREFGRNNLPHIQSRELLEVLNGDNLKALLDNKRIIKGAYYIMKIQYHKNNKVCLGHNLSSADDLTNVLLCSESYPVKLTLRPSGARNKVSTRSNTKLDLSSNNLVESIGWNRLLERLSTKLDYVKEIDLSNNNIGRDRCIAIASLLERGSSLTNICLKQNQIDDECVTLLASRLHGNKRLITLDLSNNNRITKTGWKCLLDLLWDKTSINRTYYSNHTLQDVGGLSELLSSTIDIENETVLRDLQDYLHINKSKVKAGSRSVPRWGRTPARYKIWKTYAGRYKLWKTYFNGGVFDLHQFVDMDVQIVPRVLAWLSRGPDNEDFACLAAIYHFIRNWDVPVLFGFPSAESLRIGKHMEELEKLVESLRREVKVVRDENKELREENQVLKGSTGGSIADSSETLKRRRNI